MRPQWCRAASRRARSARTPITAAWSTWQHAAVDPAPLSSGAVRAGRGGGCDDRAGLQGGRRSRDGPGLPRGDGARRRGGPNVIVATNGYTGERHAVAQRRVIPIGSYIIATEPMPAETMARLLPTDRMVSDTRKVVYYYRASPDRRRMLFGGRVSWDETDPRGQRAAAARRDGAALSRSWQTSASAIPGWASSPILSTADAHRRARRRPLCDGLLRLRRRHGELSRHEARAAGARAGRRARPPSTGSPSRRGPTTSAIPGSSPPRSASTNGSTSGAERGEAAGAMFEVREIPILLRTPLAFQGKISISNMARTGRSST